MATIKINDKDYDIEKLSDEAKGHLVSLQFVDAELQRLNANIAVFQTARSTYSQALMAALSGSVAPIGAAKAMQQAPTRTPAQTVAAPQATAKAAAPGAAAQAMANMAKVEVPTVTPPQAPMTPPAAKK